MKNWKTKKLSDVCTVFEDGDWIESKDQSSEGVRLIQTGNIGNGFFKDRGEKARYISEATFKRLRCTEIHEGDCLVSRLPDPVGRACIIPFTGQKMITAVDCTIIRFEKKEILPEWFLFFSISEEYQKAIINQVSGATRQRVSRKNLGLIEIPLPPLPEQKRIVSILDEAFAAIAKAKDNAEQNLKNAKELFESYLQLVFENKGEDWEEKTLGEVATFRNGMNFTKSSKGEKIKIVGVKDFQNSFWVPFETLETVTLHGKLNDLDLLKEGDIIAVRSNGNPQLIGRTLLCNKVVGKISHSGFTIRIRLNAMNIDPIYLCNYLKISKTRKILVDGGNGVGIKSLNQGSLSALLIPIPKTLKAQQAIVKKLNALSAETKKLETIYQHKIDNLEELKKSILQKAFSGELTSFKLSMMV